MATEADRRVTPENYDGAAARAAGPENGYNGAAAAAKTRNNETAGTKEGPAGRETRGTM